MSNKIIITEKQLKYIMKHLTQEIQENALSDVYYGMKGVFRGHGYDYFKYTNQVDNIANGMIKRTAGLDNQIIKL